MADLPLLNRRTLIAGAICSSMMTESLRNVVPAHARGIAARFLSPQNPDGSIGDSVEIVNFVSVSQFGAMGDGITDDTAAIARAIAHVLADPGVGLRFADVTYLVGSTTPATGSIFTLAGVSGFVMRGRPTFRVRGTNSKQLTLFDIQMSHVDVEYIEAVGDPWTVSILATALTRGLITCLARSPSGTAHSDHKFGTIRVTNGLHALLYDANDRRHGRITGVSVGLIDVRNCVYAFNGANSPDDHVIELIVADNIFRGYFVYGVARGRAKVQVGPGYQGLFAGGTCANICVYTEGIPDSYRNRVANTRDIDVMIHNESNRPSLQLSTNSMSPADDRHGHFNINAQVMSTMGSALKVSNANSATGIQDLTTPYASPKDRISVAAYLTQNIGCLDPNSYGVWSHATALSLECSNFVDCAAVVKHAYQASGWQIVDLADPRSNGRQSN